MSFRDIVNARGNAEPRPGAAQDAPGGPSSPQPSTGAGLACDGSHPLANRRYEAMVRKAVDRGLTQKDAYIATAKRSVSVEAAKSSASRVFARADVRARLRWLTDQKAAMPLDTQSDEIVNLEDIGRQLSKVVRAGGADSAFVSACTAALKIIERLREGQDAQLDPCVLARHLAQFAAMPGHMIVTQAGGLRFLLERFADICRITLADIHVASGSEDELPSPEVSH